MRHVAAKIYFDTCSLHRTLDNTAQLRVALEAEAVLRLLDMCENGPLTLVSSEILELEVARNPQAKGRELMGSILNQANLYIAVDERIAMRAKEFKLRGFKGFDALHLACAEAAQADYFCTCDDRLLKISKRQADLSVKAVSPLELAKEVSP